MKKRKKQESSRAGSLFGKILSPGIWRKITSVSLAVVVFFTTYMMILPALTIDLDTAVEEPGMEVASIEDEAAPEYVAAGDGEISEPGDTGDDTCQEFFDDSLISPEELGEGMTEEAAENPEGVGEELPEISSENLEGFGEELSEDSVENPEMATESLPVDEQELIDEATESADISIDGDEAPEDTIDEAETENNNAEESVSAHVLKAEGDDYRVTVSYADEAEIPDGAELQVTEILSDRSDYGYYVSEAAELLSTEKRIMSVSDARFFDITIINEEETVEPKAPVTVLVELADSFAAEDAATVIHYTEDETKVVETVDPVEAAANIEEAEAADAIAASIGETETAHTEEASSPELSAEMINESVEFVSEENTGLEELGGQITEEAAAADNTEPEEIYEQIEEEVPLVGSTLAEDIETVPTEEIEEPDFEEPLNQIAFVTDSFSVYGFVTATLEKTVLASDGHNYKVSVTCGPDAGIPEDAELSVEEITQDAEDYDAYVANVENILGKGEKRVEYVRLFDIKIVDSLDATVKYQPAEGSGVDVRIDLADTDSKDLSVVHFEENEEIEIEGKLLDSETENEIEGTTVEFETDGFSVFAIAYTVDFSYELNGKTYEFSLPGGGFVSFEHLIEALGISEIGVSSSYENELESADNNAESIPENGTKSISEKSTVHAAETVDDFVEETSKEDVNGENNTIFEETIKLNEIEVSEATKKLVANVESVEFSSPELVWVRKIEETTTVGELKESRGLEVEYSAGLTEEQIADINAQTVEAGDWALISVHPFTSEESLTVSMKNGEQFVMKVTDAQISTHVMTADGKDYIITVVYGPEAGIPDGAELHAAEITQEENTEEFNKYTATAEELLSSDIRDFIRIFDISIVKDGEELEPKVPVSVCIEYTHGVELSQDSQMKVVHFASSGAEVIENHIEETEGILNKITFETDSFSAYATISERLGDALTAKCIAYFSFDDDSSGFAGAGARASKIGTTQLLDGYSERALYLAGNGNLEVKKDDGTSLLAGLDEFTVSYWVYPDRTGGGEWAFFAAPEGHKPTNNGNGQNNEKYVGVLHNNGITTAERYNTNNSPRQAAAESQAASLNEWHHIAVVYSRNKTEVYVDGKLSGEANNNVDLSDLLGNAGYFNIGKATWGNGEYYHGYLDEFAVFNSALTAEEVAEVCNNAYYHDAKKVSVTDLRDGQSVIIYNKIWNKDTRKYDYYAVAGDGTLSPVYDVSDTIYWRHDSSLEWKLIVYYQTERDANGIPVTDEYGNPVYVLDEHGEKIESGYYEFYNEVTGKYLAPQSGSWSADEPFGVNLEGRQNGQYASTIESWDSSVNNYYGYRYDKDGTGNTVLKTASSTENADHRDLEFFFATTEILKEGELETVETVTNPNGLTIKMQNFPGQAIIYYGEDGKAHVRKDRTAYLETPLHENGSNGGGNATQGILDAVMRDGWPQINGGGNLSTIYNNQKIVDGLFIQSIYDETGYYEYSSFNNYAYLGDQERFTVYKQIGTPSSETADARFYWKRGNFFPYNSLSPDNISVNKNYYDENGNPLDENDPRYGETLYKTVAPGNLIDSTVHSNDTKNIADYYFGMTIDANFMMLAGGRDDRNNPVTYEFNGDDDMWVYIDGVLVLDLGGIHHARAGKIDFENGQITYAYPSENSGPTTIKGCFEAAGVLPNGDPWDANRVDEFFSGDTFKDYSTHTMNMYYMERGAGASNLHVKFNLPIIEEGQFSVEKKLEDANADYANKKFAYKAYKVQKIQGQDQESIIIPSTDANITCVYEGTNTPVPFDADGTFYLKAGEKAVFSVGDQMIRYYVKEVGVDSDDYDVYLNNGTNPETPQNGEVSGGIDTVQNRAHLLYRNKVKNPGLLHITKKVYSPNPVSDNAKFEFYVYLENTDGEIVPYKNGKYYVTKKTETGWDYYEYANGNLVKTADQSKPVSYEAGPYGAIGNIPDGYTIEVKDLLPGTHFLVTERLDRLPEGYSYYGKTLTADTYDAVTTDAKYSGTAPDGKIKENTAAEVIVTNVTQDFGILKDLEIRKIWKGEKAHPNEITFTVQATADKSDGTTEYINVAELKNNGTDKVYKLNDSNSWNTRIEHLPGLTSDGRFIMYHVTENTVPGYVGQEKDVTDTITVCNLKVVRLWQEGETRPETVRIKVKNSAGKYYAGTDSDGNAVFDDSGIVFELKKSEGYEKSFYHLPMDDTYTAVEIVNGAETATGGLAVYRSTVVAFDIENEPIGEQVDPEASGDNPEIHKRIDALRDKKVNPDSPHTGEDLTDLYRLYLDYKINSIQEPAGVDLLFIIDHSGSMNNNAYQGNEHRARAVQDALNGVNGVIAEFLRMNDKNRWAAVGFKGPSGFNYITNLYGPWRPGPFMNNSNAGSRDSEILSGAGTSFTGTNNGVSLPDEGDSMLTNYTAGLWRAEQFLLDPTVMADQKKKVVVFISDGIPTLHIPNLNGSLSGAGNANGSYYYPDSRGGCPDEALEEFGYFVNDMTENGYTFGDNMEFYTIGFGGSMQTAHGSALLQNMLARAYGVSAYSDAPEGHFMTINDIDGSGPYNLTAADKLKDDLRIITGLKETYTNIVIEDDLSQYVDLYGLTAEADSTAILRAAGTKVTMTDPNDTSKTITLYENGALTDQNNLAGGKRILKSVLYDKSTKTVKAVFEDDYQALPGITYTLSFDVKTTDAAYDKYVESGYDKTAGGDGSLIEITGDADTDYLGTNPANTTSSGKPGFRSNDSAKASYKHNGTDDHKDYPHPVVQAFAAEIHLLKTDQLDKPLEGAKFKLYKNAYDPADTDAARAANETNLVGSEMTSVLKGTGEDQYAEIAVKDLKPGTYYLVETHAPAGYIMSEPVKIDVIVKTTMNNTVSHDTVEVTASIGGKPIAVHGLQQSQEARLLKIINSAGYELPNTGGPGTNLLYLLGSMLIMIAGAGFGLRNRKKEKNILSAQ